MAYQREHTAERESGRDRAEFRARVKELFHAASAMEHERRRAFIVDACRADPDGIAIAEEVAALLAELTSASGFLDGPTGLARVMMASLMQDGARIGDHMPGIADVRRPRLGGNAQQCDGRQEVAQIHPFAGIEIVHDRAIVVASGDDHADRDVRVVDAKERLESGHVADVRGTVVGRPDERTAAVERAVEGLAARSAVARDADEDHVVVDLARVDVGEQRAR